MGQYTVPTSDVQTGSTHVIPRYKIVAFNLYNIGWNPVQLSVAWSWDYSRTARPTFRLSAKV